MSQVIPRKIAICVHRLFLCTIVSNENVVYTDDHNNFFVEAVDAFRNWIGDSDLNLDLAGLDKR